MNEVSVLHYVIFAVCLLLAAFFCSAETAFIGIQKLRLQHLIRTGHRAAETAARIVQKPEKFLATVLFGINLFETAVATIGTIIAVSFWGENLGAVLATIIITILTLVTAELIPKSLAARHAEKLALIYARPIEVISVILYPIVFVLSHIGIRMTKLSSDDSQVKPMISKAEFRTGIDISEEEGVVEKREAEILHNVFDFGDRPAREIMVPRTEVVWVEKGTRIADFFALYAQTPLNRYPVYQEKRDNVVGILAIKDVLMALAKGTHNKDSTIDDLLRPAYFAPESKRIGEIMNEMRAKNFHLCVVIDEYGGTAGIVTFTKLVEEIIGRVGDELATFEEEYEIIDESTFQIDGSMRLEEANVEMGLGLPEGDYETVAGFVLHLLGHIPKTGEHVKYKDLKIAITRMRGMKIEEILVTKEKHAAPAH